MNITDIETLSYKFTEAKRELSKIIIGQHKVVDEVLMALLADGHILLEGVPGLGKTLLVRSLAKIMDLDFHRIQFTPDLMPSDIIGMEVLEEDKTTGKRFFKFNKGPIFTSLLLADEINRTPPKTQSALLEAMQEREVTYAGQSYNLPKPFFLLATQNPLEQSGTYPLPEAQLDRFLFYSVVDYPDEQEELLILSSTTSGRQQKVNTVLNASDILEAKKIVKDIIIDEALISYINQIVRNTRPQQTVLTEVKQYVDWGAGPRAGQSIILAAKSKAFLNGRLSVLPEDIKQVVTSVLRHRIVLNFAAKTEGYGMGDLIACILKQINP
jgi:MoxR-like ATPase